MHAITYVLVVARLLTLLEKANSFLRSCFCNELVETRRGPSAPSPSRLQLNTQAVPPLHQHRKARVLGHTAKTKLHTVVFFKTFIQVTFYTQQSYEGLRKLALESQAILDLIRTIRMCRS